MQNSRFMQISDLSFETSIPTNNIVVVFIYLDLIDFGLLVRSRESCPSSILSYTSSPVICGTFIYVQNVLIRVLKG